MADCPFGDDTRGPALNPELEREPEFDETSESPDKGVLHINVRLSEGGAANVARAIGEETAPFGYAASYAYGYGPGGRTSPLEHEIRAIRLTSRARASGNIVSHRLVGQELFSPSDAAKREFHDALAAADVVHLHALHSYMAPPLALLRKIAASGTPIVWTMHDHWAVTGRCAQPDGCQGWRTGCNPCKFLNAYPPSAFDRASDGWAKKREAIEFVQERVPLVAVTCAEWMRHDFEVAGFRNVRSITNSVDREFWHLLRTTPSQSWGKRALFMCRDLRDKKKVNLDLLRQIARRFPDELTIVGDHLEEEVPGAEVLPAIGGRSDMLAIMRQHKYLIFSSTVDYYPLTVAEAICAGMSVLASPSPAMREFEDFAQVRAMSSTEDFLSQLRLDPKTPITHDIDRFAPTRMGREYASLYNEVTNP